MEEKTKVLIFDRKEVALIFLCMLVMALIAFSLGVKIGRNFALHRHGVTPHDVKVVELKSEEEEMVEKVMGTAAETDSKGHAQKEETGSLHSHQSERGHKAGAEQAQGLAAKKVGAQAAGKSQDLSRQGLKGLEEEFDQLDRDLKQKGGVENSAAQAWPSKDLHVALGKGGAREEVSPSEGGHSQDDLAQADLSDAEAHGNTQKSLEGKYTIQLGSYQLESDAIKFADGFKVRGYNPIINEVKIEGKGLWYRVSLGTFDSVAEAKEYVQKEESLFQGQDFVIAEF